MVVLLTGATGFLGRALSRALVAAGHEVVETSRSQAPFHGSSRRVVLVDYSRNPSVSDWVHHLRGVHAVINAVGILRETGTQTFAALHVDAAKALFAACEIARVKVVQVSALGAHANAASRYHRSKAAADDFLLRICESAVVVQPSLIYGADGASGRLFTVLASMPVIPLPGDGSQEVQPIHIDDAVISILRLLESDHYRRRRVPLAGARPITIREFIATLRNAMGLGKPTFVRVPWSVMHAAAGIASFARRSLLDRETLAMLVAGNVTDPEATRELLGREPQPPEEFIRSEMADAVRAKANIEWLSPVLRMAIAALWIWSGIVSLGLFPVEQSLALLERVGITGASAPPVLYGAAIVDIALGVATLAYPRRALWLLQAFVILGYTAIITLAMPEYWLHPFGPVSKNLPLLAAILVMYQLER